ncbi:hypothetical protein CRYUN_Cryun18bG0084200 [Craigia yunnanensis]
MRSRAFDSQLDRYEGGVTALVMGIFLVAVMGAFIFGYDFRMSANVVNYHTANIKGGWGWRVSLSLAAFPALIMISGYLFLPNTPNSILERGNTEKAKEILQRIHGAKNVEREFQNILDASRLQRNGRTSGKTLHREDIGLSLSCTLGFGDEASLTSAVITGGVIVLATFLSIYYVDRFGRSALLREVCDRDDDRLNFRISGKGALLKADANIMLILVCAFVAAYAWSWGPLGWLVPSVIYPLEIRSAGQALIVSANMFFTFFFAQEKLLSGRSNWFWGKYGADDTLDHSGSSRRRPYFSTRIFLAIALHSHYGASLIASMQKVGWTSGHEKLPKFTDFEKPGAKLMLGLGYFQKVA